MLDEPTSGLDPLMERAFTDEVRRLRDAGRTIQLSSHVLSEVEAVADRVSIIRDCRAVSTGTLDDLRGRTRLAALAWAVLAVFLLLGEFGALLGLPKAVIALTPFDHVGTLPGGALDTTGVIVVSIVTAFLLAVAAVGIRQRDIPA